MQATNGMLTRTGARTGLITTKGHEDAIIIGKVYAKVAGLPERDLRLAADGTAGTAVPGDVATRPDAAR
jgi:N-methylhydantoinase A/oxoprolinase/acetone carboxylase beta subunit